jgi:predicted permease
MLLHAKGWTLIVVLSLALGIGANTALFSAVNGLLIRKLPVKDPDTLVRFRYAGPNQMRTDVLVYGFSAPDARGRQVEPTFSYPMYQQFLEENRTLSDLFACAPLSRVTVVVNGQADVASGFLSSGNYYRALGVTARLGRTIEPDDDRPTAGPVAVISHKYWMSRFGGSTNAIGALVRVNNVPVTIVGVLAADFTGVEQAVSDAPDVSLPLSLEPQIVLQPSILQRSLLPAANFWWLEVMGRLKPGVSMAQVRANFEGVFQRTARSGFDAFLSSLPPEERSKSYLQNKTQIPELLVDSGSRGIYDASTTSLRTIGVLTAVVALVLLVVCANVANLMLSRSTARQRELSVRLALGATRARLLRQLATESLLLAFLGGVLGLFVGGWGREWLSAVTGQAPPFDWRVLAFVVGVTTASGIAFGVAPALRATRTNVTASLKEHSWSVVRSLGLSAKVLVVAQVAISLVALIGAGLFLRTLQNLRQVDVGFNPHNVLIFRVNPALNRYDSQRQARLYDELGDRLRAIGGVRSVAWSNPSLLSGRRFLSNIFIQGRAYAPGQRESISLLLVSPTFFETMEMPLVSGRGFTPRDSAETPRVAILNEAAARQYFPSESPIGRRIGSTPEESGSVEIVGVVRDAKYTSVREAAPPTRYSPFLQSVPGSASYELRTAGDPLAMVSAVREAVREVDPNLPLTNVATQVDQIDDLLRQERVFAQTYSLFGGLAMLVASVGLFGLMSYSVTRRTHEMGIRMALGAERQDVLRLIMRESMILVAAGAAIGLAAALAASRLVSNLLFGLEPADPMTMIAAMSVLIVVSALAGYVPARRASRVDPMVALRPE